MAEIAVVTGGSSGIGRCTARSLLDAGCRVYELSRRESGVDPRVHHLRADVTNEAQCQAAVDEIVRREGRIDTPIDALRWDYYQYILSHPVDAWPFKTSILYAGLDDLQPEESIRAFAQKYGADLTASVRRGNVFGCQFHPEKSGPVGMKILKAFDEVQGA